MFRFNSARIRNFMLICFSASILLSLSCRHKRTDTEQLVVDRIGPYCGMLEDYKRDNMEYPQTWEHLLRWKRISNPENPFTGEPMVSLDSPDFDPETSPGNFYYLRVIRDEQVINCQVLIFGEKGMIARYQHSGPMAPL